MGAPRPRTLLLPWGHAQDSLCAHLERLPHPLGTAGRRATPGGLTSGKEEAASFPSGGHGPHAPPRGSVPRRPRAAHMLSVGIFPLTTFWLFR